MQRYIVHSDLQLRYANRYNPGAQIKRQATERSMGCGRFSVWILCPCCPDQFASYGTLSAAVSLGSRPYYRRSRPNVDNNPLEVDLVGGTLTLQSFGSRFSDWGGFEYGG